MPQRDADRLATGAARVQPAGVGADRAANTRSRQLYVSPWTRGRSRTPRPGCAAPPAGRRTAAPPPRSGRAAARVRTTTCARSARLRPSWSSGASATSIAKPPSTSSGAYVPSRPVSGPPGRARRGGRGVRAGCRRPADRANEPRGRPELGLPASAYARSCRATPLGRRRPRRRRPTTRRLGGYEAPVVLQPGVPREDGAGGLARGRPSSVVVPADGDRDRRDEPRRGAAGALRRRVSRGPMSDARPCGVGEPGDGAVGQLAGGGGP